MLPLAYAPRCRIGPRTSRVRESPLAYSSDNPAARFLRGDRETVEQVVRWVAQVIAAPSFWALRSERSDLQQEATARLFESLRAGRYDANYEFKAYVQGVARKTAMKALTRRIQRPAGVDDERAVERASDAEESEEATVRRQLAREVLEAASDDCRRLIVSYFMEGRDYAEIAESDSTPIGTVKSRLFRCLEAGHRAIAGRRGPIRAR